MNLQVALIVGSEPNLVVFWGFLPIIKVSADALRGRTYQVEALTRVVWVQA
jgi:hypothetical protein